MDLASETLITARGWSSFDVAERNTQQEYLDFAHLVASLFGTPEGKKVLDVMIKKYLLRDIAGDNDSQIAIGRKQGRADVVKQILAQIEISNNVK